MILADMFGRLTSRPAIPSGLRLVELKMNADFVEPDALLLGDDHLLMVEVKTRGLAPRGHSYPAQQLLNYARLALECDGLTDQHLPRRFTHLIIVPSREPTWLEKHSQWVVAPEDPTDGRLRINAEAVVKLGREKTQERWGPRLVETLEHLPIYYRSWIDLVQAFSAATGSLPENPYREHWERLGQGAARSSPAAQHNSPSHLEELFGARTSVKPRSGHSSVRASCTRLGERGVRPKGSTRIISWNTNRRRSGEAVAQARALLSRTPDIVALQEVTPGQVPPSRGRFGSGD